MARQRALYRTTQRALGVPAGPSSSTSKPGANGRSKAKTKTRRRRRTTRGERVVKALHQTASETEASSGAGSGERAS